MFKKVLFLLIIIFSPIVVFAEMTSTNFTIFADSINVGGIYSTSTSFLLTDTVGEMAIGFSTSSPSSYEIRAGFQAMEFDSVLTLSVTGNSSLNLGILSSTTISSASTSVNIVTDYSSGCAFKISEVSGDSFGSLTGDVTAGEEEIGVSVEGDSDLPIVTNQTLYNLSSATVSTDLDLDLKASISASSAAGTYNQDITLLLIANP